MHQKFGIPFLPMKRPEWDKFAGAEYSVAADVLMPDNKILQQPSTHFLGQNFSKSFNIKFKDEDGKEKYVYQTCYGPAISRILASVIATHGDDIGLIMPYCISPVQVIIMRQYFYVSILVFERFFPPYWLVWRLSSSNLKLFCYP